MLSHDPVERLARVIFNLGLGDVFEAGELTCGDAFQIIACIRSADQWANTYGELPFPWTDEEIMNRLALASKIRAEAQG